MLYQELYIDTMNQLSHSLSTKLGVSVHFSKESLLESRSLKWISQTDSIIFPIYMYQSPLGSMTIHSALKNQNLLEVYDLIQWTVFSLEDIFNKHGILYQLKKENRPLLIESLNENHSLKKALEIYDYSKKQSFIHYHASIRNLSIFSEEFKNTLVFISDLSSLSEQNQIFLTQYFKEKKEGPFVVGSIQKNHDGEKKKDGMLPSLLHCFTPIKADIELVHTLQ